MKKLLTALALLLLPLVAEAQNVASVYKYNLESSTLTYCRMVGQNGNPYGAPINVNASVVTVGSSTTVTENVASSAPFTNIAVGDVIYVRPISGPQTTVTRLVTARASAASITVDVAVDLTGGSPLSYKDLQCGTGATDGWVAASITGPTAFTFEYNVGDFTSVDFRIECITGAPGAEPIQIYPSTGFTNYTTPGIASRITFTLVDPVYPYCRIGTKWVGADGGTRDEINMSVTKIERATNN